MITTQLSAASGSDIAIAARLLTKGEAVAIPTETVYGLACILKEEAVGLVFQAKGRPQDNPLIVHILHPEDAGTVAETIPPSALRLAERFWPGPLTLVLPRRETVPDAVTAGLSTVAVRCPAHEAARAVLAAVGQPLAAPSANRSGSPSPTSARHVLDDLDGRIAAVLDGGDCTVGLESTVVDCTGDRPRLLRPGGVSVEELQAVVGTIDIDPAVLSEIDNTHPVSSPGMKYRHYAPDTPMTMLHGSRLAVGRWLDAQQTPVTVLCPESEAAAFAGAAVLTYTPENLYAVLRSVDALGAQAVYVRVPEPQGLGLAVRNRLLKACGHRQLTIDN